MKKGLAQLLTSNTALIQPSFSGLLVTWAYLPHTTFPPLVTKPNSLMFTSNTVPFVITPRLVYIGLLGFFFTPIIGRQNVALSSGCVTWAFFILRPIGLINLSNLGGFLVKLSPTKVTLVTILFHPFRRVFPDLSTLNTSDSDCALTVGIGTSHLPAFSFLFCFTMFEITLAWLCCSLVSRSFSRLFCLLLLVSLDGLLHLHLLLEPLLVRDLCLDAPQLARLLRPLLRRPRLLLSLPLMVVEPVASPLLMQLDMLILRHGETWP